ncbi:MAG: hypothetical protein FWE02_00825 [Defluviitaleaceae bacterium]|nr:hypothetical protein [Defluviitaleaceae bacterium]
MNKIFQRMLKVLTLFQITSCSYSVDTKISPPYIHDQLDKGNDIEDDYLIFFDEKNEYEYTDKYYTLEKKIVLESISFTQENGMNFTAFLVSHGDSLYSIEIYNSYENKFQSIPINSSWWDSWRFSTFRFATL